MSDFSLHNYDTMTLVAKANPRQVSRGDVDDLIEMATLAAASVLKDRQSWIDSEQAKLDRFEALLQAQPKPGSDDVFALGHDLRAHADYFDFPLLAELGVALCDAVDADVLLSDDVLILFIKIARMLLNDDKRDADNPAYRTVMDGFYSVIKKAGN